WAPGVTPATPNGTTYGSFTAGCNGLTDKFCAPYNAAANPQINSVTDLVGHNHIPTPAALNMVADTFADHGIAVHFDIGSDPGGVYAGSTSVAKRFVEPAYARGGEIIQEKTCDPNQPECPFPAYPGTVGWTFGLQYYMDELECDNGQELTNPPAA